MSHIDERIVKMSFDNSNFESRITKTMDSLNKLNEVLSKTGNATSMTELSKSIKAVNAQLSALNIDEINKIADKQSSWQRLGTVFSSLGKGISKVGNGISQAFEKLNVGDKISKISGSFKNATAGSDGLGKSVEIVGNSFSALGIIGATALANITNSTVEAGKKLINAFTLEPLTTGFSEYETKMNAISTIMANTADEGATLEDVTKALNELNVYADDTIYNFAQMTENIGRFTAAGVTLDNSVASIKGLANLAALFGVDATKASSAMYQMSQAIAAGKIQLMDWNSLVNAGMGGEMFQEALIRTSELMGTGADAAIKKFGSFRESLTKGEWLTADVMIETLKQISGAYKESELRAQGYSATQAKAIVDMAERANKAATEVRTITGMLDAMKESVQSGWAISWEHIIGDKEQATELLTKVKDAFEAIIEPSTTARNNMLEFWNQNGGRDAVIKGLTNAFQGLGKVIKPIGEAWNDIFPAMTGSKLVEISNKFKDFSENLKISDSTANKIKDTFKGIFSVFKTVGEAVWSVLKGLSPLTGVFATLGNIVLTVTSGIGKFASGMAEAIEQSKVFDRISTGMQKAIDGIGNVFNNISDAISTLFGYLGSLNFGKAFEFIGKGFSSIVDMLSPVFSALGKALGTINFNTITKAMQTGTFLSVLKTLKDTFKEVGDIGESAKGVFNSFKGIGKSIKETLNSVKESLEAWQNDIQAKTILKIAAAVGILAGALLLLATIDGKELATGLAGLAVIFAELTLAYIAMFKFTKGGSLFSGISSKLYAMSISILILAGALKILSGINPGAMMTGLTGLLALLVTMAVAVNVFDKAAPNLKKTASSLIVFGLALASMALALKALGSIDAETLGAGLFAMFGVLTELALFLAAAKFGDLSITNSIGILVLSAALLVLAEGVKQFGGIKTDAVIKGLAAIGAMLAEMAVFNKLGGSGIKMASLAIGLSVMSIAIIALSKAMNSMGSMQWDAIGRGLASLAGSLLIIGAASKLISGVQLGVFAVGLIIMGNAIKILSDALKSLGGQSWEEIGKSLVSLAGALVILGVAMYAMTGCIAGAAAMLVMSAALALFIPQMVLLGQMDWTQVGIALVALAGALTVIGVAGYLLIGAIPGLLGLGVAATLIGVGCMAAGVGLTAMGAGLTVIVGLIAGSGFIIVEFLRQLISLLPQIGLKAGEAFVNFAGAIGNGLPQIVAGFTTLMTAILEATRTNIPLIAQTGMEIIVALAQALADGVPELVAAGLELLLGILNGIAQNIGQIVTAGADIIIAFMDGIAEKLPDVIDSGINLALSFIEGVADGISNNSDRLEAAIEKVINAMIDAGLAVINGALDGFINGGIKLIQGLADGAKQRAETVKNAVKSVIDKAKTAASNAKNALIQAGRDLIDGLKAGIMERVNAVRQTVETTVANIVSAAKKALDINSPSKVFMRIGHSVTEGLALGIHKYSNEVVAPTTDLADKVTDNMNNAMSTVLNAINGDMDMNPTITPVLDLSNIESNSRRLGDLLPGSGTLSLTTDRANLMSRSIGQIQNETTNSDIVSALKDLKASMSDNRPSYTINGVTYDDGSNIVNAVESLVRAARIERRI